MWGQGKVIDCSIHIMNKKRRDAIGIESAARPGRLMGSLKREQIYMLLEEQLVRFDHEITVLVDCVNAVLRPSTP